MDQLFASRSKGLRGCRDGRATNRCAAGGLPVSTYLLFAFLFALSLSARVLAKERVVKVFLIPHSHCDPGWLETFEGYHTQRVERILTEVMNSLERSPDRRFVWAEISFFSRWFDSKTAAVKQQVRKFVENGQLEFVEGGWVQPDEANTNFDILVNQLTEGHDYLLKNFGVRPRFAWQIDPFGHSSLTPTLAAAVGFDALVINRIHHNLKSYFKQTRHMEFVWQGSPSLGEQSEIFTHVLHTHYSAPLGFDFEEGSPSIVDNNVGHRAQQLVGELKSRSEAYRTDNLLVTFGDDFKFQRAEHQFSNMDKLIQEINAGQYGMKIQYATLSEYFDTVFASKANFPLYKGDFFPYADNSDSYWTGYYTTRPRLKGLIRQATSILHSADTAYALGRARDFSMHIPTSWDAHYREILQSRRDTCLVQHHDGITGTAKPFVAEDYTNRLNSAIVHSHWTMAEMTKHLLCDTKQDAAGFDVLKQVEFAVYDPQGHVFTVDASRDHPLVYHNALGWTRYQYVQVKVSAVDPLNLRIYDANDKPVPVQMSPFNSNSGVAAPADKSVFFLNFLAEVPPLGIATYFVRAVDTQSVPEAPRQFKALYYKHGDLASQSSTLKIENDFLTLMLSHTTGLPEKLINKVTGQEIALDQKYAEYHTSRSGAYLFRPSALTELTEQVEMSIVVGDLMSEVVIGFGPRRRLSLRLYSTPQDTHAYPEVCGVLFTTHQIDAGGNREVVVRYNTHLPTDNTFYTDNGIELQLRSRQSNHARSRAHIEPARADAQETQYYPSISIAMLRHNAQDLQFTVISSQSMGTTSHTEGGLEIMLNRHLSQDDGRGLGEGVPEHDPVTVQQWLMLGHAEDAELHRRRLSLQQNHPLMTITLKQVPTPFVWAEHFVNSYAPLSGSLPDNVHLLSLKARDAVSSEVVVRLMHIAEGTEAIAAPTEVLPQQFQSEVTIKLSDLLDSTTDSWVVEHPRARSLSLNYDADEVEQRVRYDSSLGSLSMKIDHSALSRGGRQNTDEEGVFLSQAALDKMESEAKEKKSKHVGRKPLSVDDSNDAGSYKHNLLNDTETYGQEVQQRGVKRRLFDPASLSIDARQRKLLAVGKDADPLTVLLRPLQMKSLLLRLASANAQPATTSTTSQVAARPVSGQREESTKEVDKLAEGRKKFREAAALRQRQKEERLRAKEEEERQRKEQGARGDIEKVIDLEDKAKTPDTRRAEPSAPGIAPSDVLYRDQQFISAGLEGERVMMMFISIVVVSLMILFYLALHRRHASAIISVSALAAAYPWTGGSAPQYSATTGVASSPAASGKDFYRREMDQRLYSKMV